MEIEIDEFHMRAHSQYYQPVDVFRDGPVRRLSVAICGHNLAPRDHIQHGPRQPGSSGYRYLRYECVVTSAVAVSNSCGVAAKVAADRIATLLRITCIYSRAVRALPNGPLRQIAAKLLSQEQLKPENAVVNHSKKALH